MNGVPVGMCSTLIEHADSAGGARGLNKVEVYTAVFPQRTCDIEVWTGAPPPRCALFGDLIKGPSVSVCPD